MEHAHCSQGSASPVSTSSAWLACALPGLVLPHPCFRGAGAKRHPSFRGGEKGRKTSLSPRAPWAGSDRSCPAGRGCPQGQGCSGAKLHQRGVGAPHPG